LREAWTAFEATLLSLAEPEPLMPAALEIAVACGFMVYEALYVALAEARQNEGAVVLAADERLISRLTGTAFAGRARALGAT
jgi:predicted nucleic acid-binding protein